MAGQNSFGSSLLQAIANLAPGLSQSIRRQASGSGWEVFTPMQSNAANLAPSIKIVSDPSYVLLAADRGSPILFTSGIPVALTLPNSFPQGWSCILGQAGTAQVQWSVQLGGVVRQADSHTRTAKQWAATSVVVISNTSGTNAEWWVFGGTAP